MHPFEQITFVARVGLVVFGLLYFARFFLMLAAYCKEFCQ
jgi:hypothetical protein